MKDFVSQTRGRDARTGWLDSGPLPILTITAEARLNVGV